MGLTRTLLRDYQLKVFRSQICWNCLRLSNRSCFAIEIDQFSSEDEYDSFFSELGSGSLAEVPDTASEDDDVAFEKQQQVVFTSRSVN